MLASHDLMHEQGTELEKASVGMCECSGLIQGNRSTSGSVVLCLTSKVMLNYFKWLLTWFTECLSPENQMGESKQENKLDK